MRIEPLFLVMLSVGGAALGYVIGALVVRWRARRPVATTTLALHTRTRPKRMRGSRLDPRRMLSARRDFTRPR